MEGSFRNRLVGLAAIVLLCVALVPGVAFAVPGSSQATADGAATSLAAGSTVSTAGLAAADQAAPSVYYNGFFNSRWVAKWQKDGATVGTKAHMLQFVKMKVKGGALKGGIQYRVYSKNVGWRDWAANGVATGERGWMMRGLQVKLTGALAKKYDVMYRVYLDGLGYQPWTVNGGIAGSTGSKPRIEAMQVKLVLKNSQQKLKDGTYFITASTNSALSFVPANERRKAGAQALRATFKDELEQRYFVRNEADGTVLIQSVASGLFLGDAKGRVVQRPYSKARTIRWKLAWNCGYAIQNDSTGNYLRIASGKVTTSPARIRWTFSSTDLLGSGTFALVNSAQGKAMAVAGSSLANGANILVQNEQESGAEAFTFTRVSNYVYRVANAMSRKAVEVAGGSKTSGANVRQNRVSSTAAQQWRVVLMRSGEVVVSNRASGKILTAQSGGGNGANVASVALNKKAPSQRWIIKAADYSLSGDYVLDAGIAKILESHGSLRSAFSYVVGFKYRNGKRFYSGPHILSNSLTASYAKDMIAHHSGNCYRFASLFSWLAKGLGYESRVKSGWVPAAAGGRAPHGWAEVKINGSWRVYDPDLAHEIPGYNWYGFTYGTAPTTYGSW